MARRLRHALILACAALAAPTAAHAATDLRLHSAPAAERVTPKEALHRAQAVREGEGVQTGRELTPALALLADKLPQLKGADRRRALRLLARPTQGQGRPGEATYDVPEAAPLCGPHFCVHYVGSTADAPPSFEYVQTMLGEFENVYNVENNQLGWRQAIPDAGRGGDDRTDVYIKNIGPDGLYGYAAVDPGQEGAQRAAYLVLDNDYAEPAFSRYSNFLPPLQVTAAHEYNHVLQYAYDTDAGVLNTWFFEATATWMEDKVYDDINDYTDYVRTWATLPTSPITRFDLEPQQDNPANSKAYGTSVFNRWVDERFGPDAIRRAWELSAQRDSFAPGAWEGSLNERNSNFFDVFTQFAVDTVEWRTSGAFEEGNTFPDVDRALATTPLRPQSATRNRLDFADGTLDHLSYVPVAVDPAGEGSLTLGGTFRRGIGGALALVGLNPDGSAVTRITRLPGGGPGTVTLENASSYSRVTAVVVNGEFGIDGINEPALDFSWIADGEPISLALNDFTKPTVRKTSPKRNARRVSRRTRVSIQFDEGIAGADRQTVKLIGPNGRSVPSSVLTNGRTLRIIPARRLVGGRRHTVKLSSAVTDPAGNRLPTSKRTFRFTTAR